MEEIVQVSQELFFPPAGAVVQAACDKPSAMIVYRLPPGTLRVTIGSLASPSTSRVRVMAFSSKDNLEWVGARVASSPEQTYISVSSTEDRLYSSHASHREK
jgi:hypothetical protein